MTVWFVWNTLSFVVVLCYFISEALIFFTASVFWLYSEAVVKVMQPKSATERYVERSEPIRVSGSHDVDFTHNTPLPAPRPRVFGTTVREVCIGEESRIIAEACEKLECLKNPFTVNE